MRISINDNPDICSPGPTCHTVLSCQTAQTFVKLFNRTSPPLLEILNPALKLYCDPHSENYSFDVVKFAYLTMPRITQRCWPYSIIYALIIFSPTRFSAQDLVTD